MGTDHAAVGDHSIEYNLNSQGYRCCEFTEDVFDSNWLVGCSYAQGTGVSEHDSLAGALSRVVQEPVLNLAQGGTGIRWACDQIVTLVNQGLRPRRLAVVWADPQRWPWVGSQGPLQPQLSADLWRAHTACDEYMINRARLDITSLRVLARAMDFPLAEITWSQHTRLSVCLPQDCRREEHLFHYPERDRARDLQHPGARSHSLAAEKIQRQWQRWQHRRDKTRKIHAREF